jgi:hypothetical protein
MPQYKYNHCIPVFLLKYWIDPSLAHSAVNVYDIDEKRFYKSSGNANKPFSFAIRNDLYVLNSDKKRAVALEKWLSSFESTLATFTQQVHGNRQNITLNRQQYIKLIGAFLSLQCRSPYNIRKAVEAIDNNANLRSSISANPDRPTKQLVLENLIHLVTDQAPQFIPTEVKVFYPPEQYNWVISDRPYLIVPGFEYRFVVLTNKVVVAFRQADDTSIHFENINVEFYKFIKKEFILNAREWLVARTSQELEYAVKIIQSDEWKQRISKAKLSWVPVKTLQFGWTIDR